MESRSEAVPADGLGAPLTVPWEAGAFRKRVGPVEPFSLRIPFSLGSPRFGKKKKKASLEGKGSLGCSSACGTPGHQAEESWGRLETWTFLGVLGEFSSLTKTSANPPKLQIS